MQDYLQLLDRIMIWSSCDPCQIRRADLLGLVEAAGLANTPVHDQIESAPGPSIVVRQAAVRTMIDLARTRGGVATGSETPRASPPPGKAGTRPKLFLSAVPPDRTNETKRRRA